MKSMKKLVLVGLVLLASVMVLAGCDTNAGDSSSGADAPTQQPTGDGSGKTETPKFTVTFNTDGGSAVDSQSVESGKMATKPEDPTLEGSWFLGWYGDKELTKEFDFTSPITNDTEVYAKWSYKFHAKPKILTGYTSPNNTNNTWTYVAFGDWPQTIKADDVTVDENNNRGMGMFTYCLGSDGNYYVKEKENAHYTGDRYKYSDGTQVGRGETSEERWFKVEPIVWRVLTEDYNSTGNALLLAEKILDCGRIWGSGSNNYKTSNIRKWLNGNSGNKEISDYNGTSGFLQTAFSISDQGLIALTDVDNSKESTFGRGEVQEDNSYACGNTEDKIFLLSKQEATTEGYGFADYNEYVGDDKGTKTSTRIRVTTDYAKATGAVLSESGAGDWLLRSPLHLGRSYVYRIFTRGSFEELIINSLGYGVVPALSISMNGN